MRTVLTRRRILGGLAALLVAWGVVAVSGGERAAAAFTDDLGRLAGQGPKVVLGEGGTAADVAAILAIYAQHNDAWCDGDGGAYASVFTGDADFVSFDGTHTVGRRQIAASHQELFDTFLQDTCLRGAVTRVKFLGGDAAVVYAVSGTRFDGRATVRRPSIQTYVAVKREGAWRFAAFHNGRIDRIENRSLPRLLWLGVQTAVLRR